MKMLGNEFTIWNLGRGPRPRSLNARHLQVKLGFYRKQLHKVALMDLGEYQSPSELATSCDSRIWIVNRLLGTFIG